MKTRKEVVEECVRAANACWNHYSDEVLDQIHVGRLMLMMDGTMPQTVNTKDWQAYADEYDRRVIKEN